MGTVAGWLVWRLASAWSLPEKMATGVPHIDTKAVRIGSRKQDATPDHLRGVDLDLFVCFRFRRRPRCLV